ncbi:MAG: adenylate/guanylate cyclase domain-containing protein, partial [Saprospiraceae bacterium]|nr:adenylate/guanylate cyclase domain-containing protein [Saprospiraceae bacterium]
MSQAVVREIDDSRRSHCAIMFTDILGFTSLMHKDEQRTILKMESHKAQLELLHREFGGEIIQYYGDGSLSIFDDSQDAINCAIAIQNHVDRLKLPLKIGIHRGEIVRKGSAIYGDGVNIASRIESIGVEKSILFSEEFWQDIKHGGYQVKSLGSLRFKNVDKPIRVMGLVQNGLQIPSRNALEGKLQNRVGQRYRSYLMATVLVFLLAIAGLWRYNMYLNSLLKDDITTMGVMPFRFDGIGGMDASLKSGLLENLVTKLSSFYGMQVLSSRSTEAYANSTQKPTEIGEELGVSHLLFGTLRQGPDDSIRINMELVDVRNGRNIWAKSYNKKPEDFFGDPADISTDLAAFLEVRENPYKHEEPESKSRMSLTTFRLLTEAREEANRGTAQSFELSNDLLQLAISKDSTLALGYALLSQNYSLMHAYGFLDAEEALDLAERNGGIAL